jgi:ketosteroid isomerase-like protein
MQLVLDWIDALRRRDVDSIAECFHPDVVWTDVTGAVACEEREPTEQPHGVRATAPSAIPRVT